MGKKLKMLAAFGVAAALCLGVGMFAACGGEKGEKGEQGIQGIQGEPGTKWFTGKGLPNDQTLEGVREGDFYINLNTNTIYVKGAESWSLLVNVNESNNVSKWDGTIPGWQAPNLSEGEIIANRPVSYVVKENLKTVDIYNAEAFAWFAYRAVIGKTGFEGYTVNLHCDIDLDNQMWVPIGLGARSNAVGVAFQGTFNGNGHTIYNLNGTKFWNAIEYGEFTNPVTEETKTGLYIPYKNGDVKADIEIFANDDREIPYGLFATTKNATIKNLNIEGINIDMEARRFEGDDGVINNLDNKGYFNYSIIADSVAAFVGFAHGDLTLQNLRAGKKGGADFIKNCQAAAGIAARIYSGKGDADGKTGEYGKLIVENCENNVAITGIAGNGDTIAYVNSVNAYNPGGNDKTGGIICDARYYSEMLITKCVNNAKLIGHNVGGIVGARQGTGSMVSPSRITECENYGEIAARSYGGGIIGFRNVGQNGSNAVYVISDCTNYGKLTYRSYDYKGTGELLKTVSGLGGIVGYFNLKSANALIVNCANYGDIEILNVSNSIGGIVGAIDVKDLNSGKLTLSNCFNAGTLSCEKGDVKISEDLIYGSVINKATTVETNSFLFLHGLVNAGSFKNLSQA